MLKKTLILGALIAIAVSPILPSVHADAGQWKDWIAEASWDYDQYKVERLATVSDMQGPFELGGAVYFTQPAKSCKGIVCDKVDVTVYADGKSYLIADVNDQISQKDWATAQNDRFVFRTPSSDLKNWFTVSEYNPETKAITKLIEPVKGSDELSFLSLATEGSRVYTSMLHTDAKTSAIESKLSVHDSSTGYDRKDFTFTLSAPWQEILDVSGDNVLAEFHFKDASKQLIIVNERARTVTEVPQSWGESHESLVAAHFLADGSVQFFKNYRMFTYTLGDKKSVEPGGAVLNWNVDLEDAYQVANQRMAWINDQDYLYVSDVDGVSNYGKVLNREFALTQDNVYFHGVNGYVGYNFQSHTWSNHVFLVKHEFEDVVIGTDAKNNIWYENTATGRVLNVGFGTDPVLSSRTNGMFRGVDGELYQVTFSSILDLAPKQMQAYKATGNPTIYLVSNNKMWAVPSESVFFSYFQSFDQVQTVSPATLAAYKQLNVDAGTATYASGTRLKSTASARVYLVGADGALHWVTSEAVANSIWGSRWNKGIISANPEHLWNYKMGSDVNSKNEIKSI